MKQGNVLVAVTIMAVLTGAVNARGEDAHAHHGHDHDEGGGIELGFSLGYVSLDEDGESDEESHGPEDDAPHEEGSHRDEGIGLHAHVGKRLGDHGVLSYVSLGIAGEVILADHEHFSLMAFASVHPWRGLVLSAGPGVEWTDHEGSWESVYSTHLEAAYVFDVGECHVGPMVEYSKTDESEHITVGVHIGIHL